MGTSWWLTVAGWHDENCEGKQPAHDYFPAGRSWLPTARNLNESAFRKGQEVALPHSSARPRAGDSGRAGKPATREQLGASIGHGEAAQKHDAPIDDCARAP